MIPEIDELFGNTDEVKVLTAIIPGCIGQSFTIDQLQSATGIKRQRLEKVVKSFQELKIINKYTGNNLQVSLTSHGVKAIHNLIYAAYEDRLCRQQRMRLGIEKEQVPP